MVITSSVEQMCNDIMNPPAPLALPALSTLILGTVRINDKKAFYLLQDAHEAQVQLRTLTTKTNVNLPAEKQAGARFDAITLPEHEAQFVLGLDIVPEVESDSLEMAAEESKWFTLPERDITLPRLLTDEEKSERGGMTPSRLEHELEDLERSYSVDFDRYSLDFELSRIEAELAAEEMKEEAPGVPEEIIPEFKDVIPRIEEEAIPTIEEEKKEPEIEGEAKLEDRIPRPRLKRRHPIEPDATLELSDRHIQHQLSHPEETLCARPLKMPKTAVPQDVASFLRQPPSIFEDISSHLSTLIKESYTTGEVPEIEVIFPEIELARGLEEFAPPRPSEISIAPEPYYAEPSTAGTLDISAQEAYARGIEESPLPAPRLPSELISPDKSFVGAMMDTPEFKRQRPSRPSVIPPPTAPAGEMKPTRLEAAISFFNLLVLKTMDVITVEQDIPYGEIKIISGDDVTTFE